MAYVRTKEIPPGSGRHYRYLQRSYREGDQVKTETVKYLGPAGGKNDTSYNQSEIPKEYRGEIGTTESEGKTKSNKIPNKEYEVIKAYFEDEKIHNYMGDDDQYTIKNIEKKDENKYKVTYKKDTWDEAQEFTIGKSNVKDNILKMGKSEEKFAGMVSRKYNIKKTEESDKAIKLEWSEQNISHRSESGWEKKEYDAWLPKSQVREVNGNYYVPEWLRKKKKLPKTHPEEI